MHSPTYQQSSPHGGGGTPNSEKSSTRRKQRCPTKSAHEQALISIDVGDESEEENAEVSTISEQHHPVMYQQEIVNISPVTVTCSSNGREEIVGYNQTQFLDEVWRISFLHLLRPISRWGIFYYYCCRRLGAVQT